MLPENVDDLKLKELRILFGADFEPGAWHYRTVYRFLETDDEYFPYSIAPRPIKGRWRIYGLFLPADVLRKVYVENAARLTPGLAR